MYYHRRGNGYTDVQLILANDGTRFPGRCRFRLRKTYDSDAVKSAHRR